MKGTARRFVLIAAMSFAASLGASPGAAELPSPAELVRSMRSGGYVLVMRHAASPRERPDAAKAAPGNAALERQLDDSGIAAATRMGAALKQIKLPVGDVWSSPTFRARQTASFIGLPKPTAAEELGDGGQSMSAVQASQANWLRSKASQAPRKGTNTILITHFPNIRSAFGDAASGVADGEALVFHPDGTMPPKIVGRIKMEDWPALVK
jgi:phosphohistidine phosphatase SixA